MTEIICLLIIALVTVLAIIFKFDSFTVVMLILGIAVVVFMIADKVKKNKNKRKD